MMPPADARKKPGSTRAVTTSAMADPGWSPPMRRATSIVASSPIQSPNELTTCAVHRRRKPGAANNPGREPSSSAPFSVSASASDASEPSNEGFELSELMALSRLGAGRV